jgi:Ca2+-binding EF-hand superfamily protein
MEHLRASFERELKNKLSEKTRGAQSEEQVLLKAFKYFDLNDNGVVEPDEFAKAIEKIGIQIPTRQDLEMLFNIYDADQSGGIDYKEFSGGVFGKAGQMGGGAPQGRTGGFGTASSGGGGGSAVGGGANDPESLAVKLKDKLATRGSRGIIGLQRQFKIMDDDGSRSLNKYEFSKAMNDFMLGFNQAQISVLFDYFDVDSNGTISYDEFLRSIRGPMNMARKKIVAQAFKKLDKDGNGWIDINDVRGVYKADKHPDVKSGKKTEDQILQEFLETFETAHAMRNNDAPNYVVTKEEFDEYYNNISASIDDDMYFMTMMNNAWKLTEESRQG